MSSFKLIIQDLTVSIFSYMKHIDFMTIKASSISIKSRDDWGIYSKDHLRI